MLILTDVKGNEIRELEYSTFDFDMNDDMDFEIKMPSSDYKSDLVKGARVFCPDTEYGGIIGGLKTDSENGTITITGRTWRGITDKKIIRPASGKDYYIVSGDGNAILDALLKELGLKALFRVPTSGGLSIDKWQFDRYCTLYEGLTKMYKSYDHKLRYAYKRGEKGVAGYVQISAEPVQDYSNRTEISQNNDVYFSLEQVYDRVNHLICLGKGELKDRTVLDLYLQGDGTIGTKQYYTGLNEVVETYDYPSVESVAELRSYGKEKLQKESNYQTMNMDIYDATFSALIGDIVGGRDYITGIYLKQPITNIIYKEERGISTIQYVVDGDIDTSYDFVIQTDYDDDTEAVSINYGGTSAEKTPVAIKTSMYDVDGNELYNFDNSGSFILRATAINARFNEIFKATKLEITIIGQGITVTNKIYNGAYNACDMLLTLEDTPSGNYDVILTDGKTRLTGSFRVGEDE